METNNTAPEQEPKPLTPQQSIDRERNLINNLYRIGGRYPNTTFLQQLDKAVTGCDNRIRAIQVENGMEVTV